MTTDPSSTSTAAAELADTPGAATTVSTPVKLSRGRRLVLLISAVVTVGLVIASLMVGGYDITWRSLLEDPDALRMFFISRVPRTLALILTAIAMSISGVIMQMITQNRFAEPTTAGTAQWAGLGVLVGFAFFPSATPMIRMLLATGFALGGTLLFIFFLRRVAVRNSLVVPLVGIMLGSVVGAFTTFLANEKNLLQSLSSWRSGGFSSIVRGFYEPLWAVLIIAILAYALANWFTVIGLGKDLAVGVGVNYNLIVLVGVVMVALASGVTSVVVGFVPFLGLIVPNMVSMLLGDNIRRNIPWVAVIATGLLLLCDLIGRVVVAPMEIPATVILGVVGAVVFIAMVIQRKDQLSA